VIGPGSTGRSCAALGLILIALTGASRGVGQTISRSTFAPGGPDGTEWDSAHARRLIERAIERRASWTSGADLRDYQAHARGHIYFLFDLGRNTERHLIKADQMALNLFWLVPGRTKQIIVGHRDEKLLPTNIHYHLDHLTVVMDNFGDRVSLGEGSEVRDALHPAAPGALDFYQYRLSDSLSLQLPTREVQVHRVEMRPRDPRQPGLVGAVFLDRDSADIVRMDFTFTAASYLDKRIDYINVRLENAMWGGRYWLPYRQGIELRREVEMLKFPAGGIIRAEFGIGDYRFNTDVPEDLFHGVQVVYAPARSRRDFEFEQDLYDALDPTVAINPPSMEEIQKEATRIVSESYLQRAQRLRLAVPGVSSVLRFRRAEGLYLGPGLGRSATGWELLVLGGYAIGAERSELYAAITAPVRPSVQLELDGYWNKTDDVAPWPASSGAVATLGAIFDGDDYRDPYWAKGGGLSLVRRWDRVTVRIGASWENWESAALAAEDLLASYRPVRSVNDGDAAFLTLKAQSSPVSGLEAVGGMTWDARVEGATALVAGDFDYVYAVARAEQYWTGGRESVGLKLRGAVGAAGGGTLPAQRLMPVGGRGSVRGYRFHEFVGNLYAVLGAEANHNLWHPYVSLGLFAEAAWTGIEGSSAVRAADVWNQNGSPAGGSRGALVGVGASLGLLFDIIYLDLARGLSDEGIWEAILRVRSDFWPWL
jgi:hypothetical protein